MKPSPPAELNRRKAPRQARSAVTVDAIFEGTIQVLLADGSTRLNTTRVAQRAGVSVGTLYQYFPNKQAVLFAVLERHLAMIVSAVQRPSRRYSQGDGRRRGESLPASEDETVRGLSRPLPDCHRARRWRID